MKLAAVLALAAASCGSPRPVRTEKPIGPKVTPVEPQPTTNNPTPIVHEPRAALEAPHGGMIVSLTAAPEGDAVLSIDELGGVRLWPSLDGKREPKLVELPVARELALGHRPDGYTAVARDEVGGLYIAKLDSEGRTISHTTLGVEPPFTGMAMTSAGLLAWRQDHHVLLLDENGATRGDLPTEPQQRVVDIAVAGGKALAMLETGGRRKARWLTLTPKLAWGAWIASPDAVVDLGLVASSITLSPDHAHFATAGGVERKGFVTLYETKTGKTVSSSPITVDQMELEFVDANLLAAVSSERGLHWLIVKEGASLTGSQGAFARTENVLAVAGGQAVLPTNGELMLLTPTATQFLGYGTLAPQFATAGPDGKLLVVGASSNVLLDAKLEEVGTPHLGIVAPAKIAAVLWVGGDEYLVESAGSDQKLKLAIANGVSGKVSVVRDGLKDLHYLAYERSTQFVAMSFGSQSQVGKLDLAAGTLKEVTLSPKKSPYEEIGFSLVSPTLGRGQQLVEITLKDKPTLRWFKAPGDKPTASVTIDGAYLGGDAAGRVYAWRTGPHGSLEAAVYADGKVVGTLPTARPASLWPDPSATLVAEATEVSLTLYRDFKQVWTKSIDGVHEVHWLSDGAIAITHVSGIARLDAATGNVTAARCGWDFGLSTKAHPLTPRNEPLCAQLAE
jgi:hypothetical protein